MVFSMQSLVVIDQKYVFAFFVRISFEQENFKLPPSLPPDFRKVWLFQQISPVWGSHLELLPLLWNHKLHKPKTFGRASTTNFGPAPSHQTFSKYGNVPSCTISAKNCTKGNLTVVQKSERSSPPPPTQMMLHFFVLLLFVASTNYLCRWCPILSSKRTNGLFRDNASYYLLKEHIALSLQIMPPHIF